MPSKSGACLPKYMEIKGARTHNLKNVSLNLPHHQLIVITGLSGSGKSSLAFDTLFAEGQRRYMESLSAYARQFLGKIDKPPVDYIKGILPSIGMQQKTRTHNPRARVSTSCDIYPYLKLLYARIGTTYSPVSGQQVKKHTVADVVSYVQGLPAKSKVLILAPLQVAQKHTQEETLQEKRHKGFTRVLWNHTLHLIEDILGDATVDLSKGGYLVVDRVVVKPDDASLTARLGDSVQTAFLEGKERCVVKVMGGEERVFSTFFEADGMHFEHPSLHFFGFNNPYGACKDCGGLGKRVGVDPDKVIPNPNLSVAAGAILPWQTNAMSRWQDQLCAQSHQFDFPIHKPYKELTAAQQALLWKGNVFFKGIFHFFEWVSAKTHKIQYRVLQARYRGFTSCIACRGTGLRKDAGYVKIRGKGLIDVLRTPVDILSDFFEALQLTPHEKKQVDPLLAEIKNRLCYLKKVGLGYLTLHRPTHTLSGGEYQRICLAKALGSTLTDVLYILDEPTIGLHPKDTAQLLEVLVALQKAGNTVVVVEHEEAVMRAADQIIDIGPLAGAHGGKVVFQGSFEKLVKTGDTHTARYLNGKASITTDQEPRKWKHAIKLKGACEHNLKDITVQFPLEVLTVVTGVSGSGKSTLVEKVLYQALCNQLKLYTGQGKIENLTGDVHRIADVEQGGQNLLGKSSRSNPVTYVKAYDGIRRLFALAPVAQERGYTPATFSFNVAGGRCEACLGAGETIVEMQFMADIPMVCESCQGKRFKKEVLEVTFKGKHIAQILDMTVDEALIFFKDYAAVTGKLQPLQDVGLGYLRLGQPSSTFSGGEAQRVKLSTYLSKGSRQHPTFFIFDEPTTGLHFHDISKLMKALAALVEQGHTVLVIEHNVEVIRAADWIIDLGPAGGAGGGQVLFAGTPRDLIKLKDKNHTAQYLAQAQSRKSM